MLQRGRLLKACREPLGIVDCFPSPPQRRAADLFIGLPFVKADSHSPAGTRSPCPRTTISTSRYRGLDQEEDWNASLRTATANARLQATRELGKGYREPDYRAASGKKSLMQSDSGPSRDSDASISGSTALSRIETPKPGVEAEAKRD